MEKKTTKGVLFSIILMILFFCLGRGLAYYTVKEKKEQYAEKGQPKRYEETTETEKVASLCDKNGDEICILLDAGHGGMDPGKVGINGSLEKDINLSIVKKLGDALKKNGVKVYFTRTKDETLGNGKKGQEKMSDLNNRIKMMTDLKPLFTISIHQNSFPKEAVSGPQVFYREGEEEGRCMAQILQDALIEELQPQKERESKGNMSYYLLKKATIPTVIVECGFLSNTREADLLKTESYQEQVVKGITRGILRYLKEYETF